MNGIYKLLGEMKSVIWEEDPKDPKNPEVLVSGLGRYKLDQLKRNVQDKLADLAQTTDWEQIAWKLDHAAMKEMVRTIVAADKELSER